MNASFAGPAAATGHATLSVSGLSKVYGVGERAVRALDDIGFSVESGEFVCIVGPSGVGKTTLLKCLCGLMPPTAGSASFSGRPIAGPPEGLGVVFQDYSRSLAPWMSVLENVALPLRVERVSRAQRAERVRDALRAVGLAGVERRYPWQLSGGMQQRVAIARGLVCNPKLLLMDEPFASVDAQTRADLEDLTLRVRAEYGITVVLVTHDIDEAVYLADRIVVLQGPPATVREIVTVDLPAERDQVGTKSLAEFVGLRARVYSLVRKHEAGS